jgi:hypothetical protein
MPLEVARRASSTMAGQETGSGTRHAEINAKDEYHRAEKEARDHHNSE